jgi:hypothetical protein
MFGVGSESEPGKGEAADVASPQNDKEETRAWYAWTYEGGSNWLTIWEARYWLLGTLLVGGAATYIAVSFLRSVLTYALRGEVSTAMWVFAIIAAMLLLLFIYSSGSTESSWSSALSSVGSG